MNLIHKFKYEHLLHKIMCRFIALMLTLFEISFVNFCCDDSNYDIVNQGAYGIVLFIFIIIPVCILAIWDYSSFWDREK